MCGHLARSVRRCTGPVVLALGACLGGCESANAPPPPSAYSLVGDYVLTWGFLMADEGTFLTATGPLDLTKIHGTINCPGEFNVTRQTAAGISGTFRAMSGASDCFSQQGDFCASAGVPSFCRSVSGSWSGTFFPALLPGTMTATLSFSTSSGGSPVEPLTGCRVVAIRAPEAGFATFRLPDSTISALLLSGAGAMATIDCPVSTGFGRVDVSVLFRGGRTSPP